MRSNYSRIDLTTIVGAQVAEDIQRAALVSMGTEITADDLKIIQALFMNSLKSRDIPNLTFRKSHLS